MPDEYTLELIKDKSKELALVRSYIRLDMVFSISKVVIKYVIISLLIVTLLVETTNSNYKLLGLAITFILIMELMRTTLTGGR